MFDFLFDNEKKESSKYVTHTQLLEIFKDFKEVFILIKDKQRQLEARIKQLEDDNIRRMK